MTAILIFVLLCLGVSVWSLRLAIRQHKAKVKDRQATGPALPPFLDVPAMMERGDWNGARRALQKMAYEYANSPPEQKQEFTNLMKKFSLLDPLYLQCMELVLPIVQAQPGIKQTALYDHMPTNDVETARYVLYFAHELGHIVRRKKGNSYAVFLPDQ